MLKRVQLVGKRVKLIPLEKGHTSDLYEAARPSDIWTYMPTKGKSLEDIRNIVENAVKARENGTELPFTVYDLDTNCIIGSTRLLNISLPNKSTEIGWTWYSPSVWRTRVNTECKYLLLRYCFEELQLNRVQFKTDVRNERSRNAILRLGALQEGIIRKERVLQDGYVRDSAMYSIIKEEWHSVKQRLEDFLQVDVHTEIIYEN
jgi:N-acetyltransferase